MPWKSKKQARWGNSPTGKKELGAKKVHEFNEATKNLPGGFDGLPEDISDKEASLIIGKIISHSDLGNKTAASFLGAGAELFDAGKKMLGDLGTVSNVSGKALKSLSDTHAGNIIEHGAKGLSGASSKASEFFNKQFFKARGDLSRGAYDRAGDFFSNMSKNIQKGKEPLKNFMGQNAEGIGKALPALGLLGAGALGLYGAKKALPHVLRMGEKVLGSEMGKVGVPLALGALAPKISKVIFNDESMLSGIGKKNPISSWFSGKKEGSINGYLPIEVHPDYKDKTAMEPGMEILDNPELFNIAGEHMITLLNNISAFPEHLRAAMRRSPKEKAIDMLQGAGIGLGTALAGRYIYDNLIDDRGREKNIIMYPQKIQIKKANVKAEALEALEKLYEGKKATPMGKATKKISEVMENHPYMTPLVAGMVIGAYGPSVAGALVGDLRRNYYKAQNAYYNPYGQYNQYPGYY